MKKITTLVVAIITVYGAAAVSAAGSEQGVAREAAPAGEDEYESPPDDGEAAEDEYEAAAEDALEAWHDLTDRNIKRSALAAGFNVDLAWRPPAEWTVGLGVHADFILKGLLAVGPTFDVDLLRDVDVFSDDMRGAWFGGVAGRLYLRPYYAKMDVKPYVGAGGGLCGVPVGDEFLRGYYGRYGFGVELVFWPSAVFFNLGGRTEVAGGTRTYFTVVSGVRFFI
jgi:hypothetical protein